MALGAADFALFAGDIARVFGAAAAFEAPANEKARSLIRSRVAAILGEVRPHPAGPSLGEALAARNLPELSALFEQAAFRRTKRAARGRLFAELVTLFELEPLLGLAPAAGDVEEHLRRVRRALRTKG
jgi:hypothetical protein